MDDTELAKIDKENKEHELAIEKERKLTALYLLLTVVAIGLMTFVWHSRLVPLFVGLIVGVLLARMNYK